MSHERPGTDELLEKADRTGLKLQAVVEGLKELNLRVNEVLMEMTRMEDRMGAPRSARMSRVEDRLQKTERRLNELDVEIGNLDRRVYDLERSQALQDNALEAIAIELAKRPLEA